MHDTLPSFQKPQDPQKSSGEELSISELQSLILEQQRLEKESQSKEPHKTQHDS